MSSQTAYQQLIWAVKQPIDSLSTAYQQLNEQSMSSPAAYQQQYNSTTEQVWGETQISILNSKSN